jgi:hypothetical protein
MDGFQGHSHGVYPLIFLPDGMDQTNLKGGGANQGESDELLHQGDLVKNNLKIFQG